MLLNNYKINLDVSRKDKHKIVSAAETRGEKNPFFLSFSKISVKMENRIHVEVSEC